MKQKNHGFTLVETIIVMAIMAVLASMLFIGLAIIPRNAARSCAKGIKTVIGQTRIMTMGKDETVLELYQDTDGRYYTVHYADGTALNTPEECGKTYVTVYYHEEGAAGDPDTVTAADCTELSGSERLYLGFDRGNGKMASVSASVGAGTVTTKVCDAIVVTGGGLECRVRIYPATGKVMFE